MPDPQRATRRVGRSPGSRGACARIGPCGRGCAYASHARWSRIGRHASMRRWRDGAGCVRRSSQSVPLASCCPVILAGPVTSIPCLSRGITLAGHATGYVKHYVLARTCSTCNKREVTGVSPDFSLWSCLTHPCYMLWRYVTLVIGTDTTRPIRVGRYPVHTSLHSMMHSRVRGPVSSVSAHALHAHGREPGKRRVPGGAGATLIEPRAGER